MGEKIIKTTNKNLKIFDLNLVYKLFVKLINLDSFVDTKKNSETGAKKNGIIFVLKKLL
mgnify:CR=1|tara:strand:+ start:216 stop:392 length:177 start_codon:yes stop_codon:yes gene_type:complete